MANEEQLSILKQGVDVWNKWRSEDLKKTDDILEVWNPDSGTYYIRGNFHSVDFTQAQFPGANLQYANLLATDFSGANLRNADLSAADLKGANLSGADLRGANLAYADLLGSNFSRVLLGDTTFGYSDLSRTIGLESVIHLGPSTLSTDSFMLSAGKIPEVFLRGCGLNDADIVFGKMYNPDLSDEEVTKLRHKMNILRAEQPQQISPLFVSYSQRDSEFVDKIGHSLTKKGIRYWRNLHDMTAGRMEIQIDRAIRQNPTVLLVLSENSLNSNWVEHEVREARKLEQEMGRNVLYPVALDDRWKDGPWAGRTMEQVMKYNILDFSAWEHDSKFGATFNKLIDGLGLFYK